MQKLTLKLIFDGVLTGIWVILMVRALTGAFWQSWGCTLPGHIMWQD